MKQESKRETRSMFRSDDHLAKFQKLETDGKLRAHLIFADLSRVRKCGRRCNEIVAWPLHKKMRKLLPHWWRQRTKKTFFLWGWSFYRDMWSVSLFQESNLEFKQDCNCQHAHRNINIILCWPTSNFVPDGGVQDKFSCFRWFYVFNAGRGARSNLRVERRLATIWNCWPALNSSHVFRELTALFLFIYVFESVSRVWLGMCWHCLSERTD